LASRFGCKRVIFGRRLVISGFAVNASLVKKRDRERGRKLAASAFQVAYSWREGVQKRDVTGGENISKRSEKATQYRGPVDMASLPPEGVQSAHKSRASQDASHSPASRTKTGIFSCTVLAKSMMIRLSENRIVASSMLQLYETSGFSFSMKIY